MLISGNTIVVIGYSYARGGTEIGLFEISRDGSLALQVHVPPALQRLLLVAQLREPADRHQADLLYAAPSESVERESVRAVPGDAALAAGRHGRRFQTHRAGDAHLSHRRGARPVPGRRAAHRDDVRPREARARLQQHRGDGARRDACSMSPTSRCSSGRRRGAAPAPRGRRGSAVFRIPLDASAPSALKAAGSPIDQFSFLESDDGHLNVLLRGSGARRRHVGRRTQRRAARAHARAAIELLGRA